MTKEEFARKVWPDKPLVHAASCSFTLRGGGDCDCGWLDEVPGWLAIRSTLFDPLVLEHECEDDWT